MRTPDQMSVEELEFRIAGLEEEVEEYYELLEGLESCNGIEYAIEEGFIEAVEEDGEIRFFCIGEAEVLS